MPAFPPLQCEWIWKCQTNAFTTELEMCRNISVGMQVGYLLQHENNANPTRQREALLTSCGAASWVLRRQPCGLHTGLPAVAVAPSCAWLAPPTVK